MRTRLIGKSMLLGSVLLQTTKTPQSPALIGQPVTTLLSHNHEPHSPAHAAEEQTFQDWGPYISWHIRSFPQRRWERRSQLISCWMPVLILPYTLPTTLKQQTLGKAYPQRPFSEGKSWAGSKLHTLNTQLRSIWRLWPRPTAIQLQLFFFLTTKFHRTQKSTNFLSSSLSKTRCPKDKGWSLPHATQEAGDNMEPYMCRTKSCAFPSWCHQRSHSLQF